jgi:hypothetical protein
MECGQLLNNKVESIKWVKFDRNQRNNALSEDVKCIVIKWWIEETKVSPNMKDVCRLVATKTWEKHAILFL